MDVDRWIRAQQAERESGSFQQSILDPATAEMRMKLFWGMDYEAFENSNILAVGGGNGIIHGIENADRLVSIDPLNSDFPFDKEERSPANIITGAGENLPFCDSEFDYVISFNVLDHTFAPHEVLSEIHRVLTSGGCLLLGVNVLPRPIVTDISN